MTLTLEKKIKAKKKWTYKDYDLLPPEFRCEIRNGELIMAPSPTFDHQDISGTLEMLLFLFVSKNKLGKIIHAPMDVYFDEENVLQPDIIFISNKNKKVITEKNIHGSPDMVAEILSNSSIKADRVEKMEIYTKFRVSEYWIVDPANRSVEVYELVKKQGEAVFKIFSFAAEKGIIHSKAVKGFKMNIEKIFKK
jgi:Uma2 family endonuclease